MRFSTMAAHTSMLAMLALAVLIASAAAADAEKANPMGSSGHHYNGPAGYEHHEGVSNCCSKAAALQGFMVAIKCS